MAERFDYDEASDSLVADLGLAMGALAVVQNDLLKGVAQRLYDARPLLAALVSLGHVHIDELRDIIAQNEGRK